MGQLPGRRCENAVIGRGGRLAGTLTLALAGLLPAGALGAGAAARATAGLTQPRPGDWEGIGPHGLRVSFQLTGRGRRARVHLAVVSLPDGCRTAPEGGFSTVNLSKVHYYPPSRTSQLLPGGAFTIKRPGQFAIIGTDVDIPKYPVVITGSFRTGRTGSARVPVYPFKCPSGSGWSKWSRFSLRRSQRTKVADGSYSGTVSGPGISGTVKATVRGGGRDLTDLVVSWQCSGGGGGGSFELGPSRAAGEFIGPTGAIAEHWTPTGTWSGHFTAGHLTGTIKNQSAGDCTVGQSVPFSASHP